MNLTGVRELGVSVWSASTTLQGTRRLQVSWRGLRQFALAMLGLAAGLAGLPAMIEGMRTLADIVAVLRSAPPALPVQLDLRALLTDPTPIAVTTTVQWTTVRKTVTTDAVLHDPSLWREMNFNDWDRLPARVREPALRTMARGYQRALAGPATWRGMTTADWDNVPQPIRAMAFLRMIWYWAEQEGVGREYGLSPARAAQTIGAIVMAESWFEHHAVNDNGRGNRDLGLAQCSDYCRQEIARMALDGEIGFAPAEADYFDPFVATRVATVWFRRELRRADGDVDLAIRAYHRGIDAALDERGDTYLRNVLAKRSRYIRNADAPPAWRFLSILLLEQARQAAPTGTAVGD